MLEDRKQEVGDYTLGRTLGKGTTGKVRIATKQSNGQQYAIKIVKKSLFEAKPHLETKIRREVGLMRLLNHPHLLKFEECFESHRHFYIVLEYAENGELFDFLIKRKSLTLECGMHFFHELLYGLEYLHEHAICHRDLKPENILLDQFNHIKIADFGFARWMRSNIAETSCGSPHYAAPEVIKGSTYDGRAADIWSLGVILFALLAGRLPFDDPSIRNLLAKVKSGRYRMPDFPPPIQDLISKMLTVDPNLRITIEQIKVHPSFRMFCPEKYVFPTPLRLPFIASPVDPKDVPWATYTVLKSIGYQSDEEINEELRADTHTMAKVFAHMLTRNISIDTLKWPTDSSTDDVIPNDAFIISPNVLPMGSANSADSFGRRRAIPDVSSPETFSLVERRYTAEFNEMPELEMEPQSFEKIPIPIEELMLTLQTCLSNAQYEWLHPDDLHIYARNTVDNSYVVFTAIFIDDDMLRLTMLPVRIESDQFNALIETVSISIQEAIDNYSANDAINEAYVDA